MDMSAGDAAPFLERDMYILLGFEPSFDELPERCADTKKVKAASWSLQA